LRGRTWGRWGGLSAGLFAPLAAGGSVVLCRHLGQLGEEGLAKRMTSERVTNSAV
ncbi:TIGR03089 family protein, partial [Streptomyces sp. NPDC089733]